jgi:predicted nucleic acid-binding Zn ribbon protein
MNPRPRKITPEQRIRHRLLSAWRGLPEPPLINYPANKLGSVLDKVVKDLGLADRMRLEEVLSAWKTVAGDFVSRQTKPETCVKGVLTVRILQPTVHFAMLQEKPRLLEKLNQHLGAGKVKDIKFRHG